MKQIDTYIKENTTQERVDNARNNTEIIVKKFFELKGYKVNQSTKNEDFNGIDLKVYSTKEDKDIYIDVKCSENKNQKTRNFLYTTSSVNGKLYTRKKTDYVAFIDFPTNSITLISFDKLKELIDKTEDHDSRDGGMGKFHLLPKSDVRELGNTYDINTGKGINL